MSDSALRLREEKEPDKVEGSSGEQYAAFRRTVLESQLCGPFQNSKEVELETLKALLPMQGREDLSGWVPGSALADCGQVTKERDTLREACAALELKLVKLELERAGMKKPAEVVFSCGLTFSELLKTLGDALVGPPEEVGRPGLLELLFHHQKMLSDGFYLPASSDDPEMKRLFDEVVPALLDFGLLQKIPYGKSRRRAVVDISEEGRRFLALARARGTPRGDQPTPTE